MFSVVLERVSNNGVIHSKATRPIVPEDNTDLNGFTADPQVPYQPQGSLVRSELWIALLT
ncbi:UNVERIFIED_CONTAM: hypothetical protein FKN15_053549 [Acipenser sinensis]